jgi:hypothetical protein
MSGGYISFFNASTAFSDAELASALPDFQSQVSNEFNWYWGLNAYLDINGSGSPIIIVDYPGQNDPAGALGYHYIDGNYQPYAVIFAGLCRDYGYPITGVISHELLEMMADQLVDTVNLYDYGNGTGVIVIQEVCDPCESNLYYEAPNGNVVSDFALPAWWVPGDPCQVDFLGAIPGPWQLASGGYISYQNVTLSGWQQTYADKGQQQMARAAEAVRSQLAAAGNPRVDVIRQLQLKGAQGGAQMHPHAEGAPRPVRQVRGQVPAPQHGQISLDRRVQPARTPGQIKVVKRQDVPQVGPSGPTQQPTMQNGQQQLSASASRRTSGPKVQSVPEAS